MLRLLGAAPIGLALGCGTSPGGVDASRSDAGVLVSDASAPDAGFDAGVCSATDPDARGPFFEAGSPARAAIAGPEEPGTRLFITGSLLGVGGCAPLAGYTIDLWQADVDGNYYTASSSDYRLRGRVVTGADGAFYFESIKPGSYVTPTGPRPSHVHASVYAPDGSERLTTQLYFVGDPYQGVDDGCQPPTCFSGDPDRHIALESASVDGRDGLAGQLRIVVPA